MAEANNEVVMDYYDANQLQPPYTVSDAMRASGFTADVAETVADELFIHSFKACKDKSKEALTRNFKALSAIAANKGGIKFTPKQQSCIEAFTQWVKHQYRMGRDPSSVRFEPNRAYDILERATTHDQYLAKHEAISAAAKPEKLTKDIRWDDWYPSFQNYLRAIPGRNGIPLLYVIRDDDEPNDMAKEDYLDEYVLRAKLSGEAYIADRKEVHTYITNLIAQNEEAEAVVKILENERDGRKDWKSLKLHYEGQGVFTSKIVNAEKDIDNLIYIGEKAAHMNWLTFEQKLTGAFNTLVHYKKREVYDNDMKLRKLLGKIKCDWLQPIATQISVELTKIPITFTYERAMLALRTEVQRRFPPGSSPGKIRRTIQKLEGDSSVASSRGSYGSYRGRGYNGGRGRGRGRGYGRGYGRGRGRGYQSQQYRNDQETKQITLLNGKTITYHPSIKYADHIYQQFTPQQKDMLREERARHRERNGSRNGEKRTIEELYQSLDKRFNDLESKMSHDSRSIPPEVSAVNVSRTGEVSQVTTGTTIMGGRNEQASIRSHSRGGRKG